MRRFLAIIVGSGCAIASGCQSTQMPRLFSWPSSASQQRQQATMVDNDPYPQNEMQDAARSDVRPRDFDRPSSEVKRSQQSPWAPLSIGR